MIAFLLAALVTSAPVSRPQAVAWTPNLGNTWPRTEAWLPRGSASPFAKVNLELLAQAGIKRDGNAWLWLLGDGDPLVFEGELRSVAQFESAMQRAVTANRAEAGGRGEFVLLETNFVGWRILREDDRVFVVLGVPRPTPGQNDPIEIVRKAPKPRTIPRWWARASDASSPTPVPDFVISASGRGFDNLEVVVVMDPKAISVRGEVALDFAAGLIFGDLGLGGKNSTPLVVADDPAAELTASLAPSVIGTLLETMGLSIEHAKSIAGPVHGALTRKGAIIGAALITPSAKPEHLARLIAEVEKRVPFLQLNTDGNLLRFGTSDPSVATRVEKDAAARAQVEVRAEPKYILGALNRLANQKPTKAGAARPKLPRMHLVMAKALYQEHLSRLGPATLRLSFPAGKIAFDASVTR